MAETVDPVHNAQNAGVHWTEPLETLFAQLDGLLAISIIFLISTTVANGLRLYTRIRILRSAGLDDWAILISQVGYSLVQSSAWSLTEPRPSSGHLRSASASWLDVSGIERSSSRQANKKLTNQL